MTTVKLEGNLFDCVMDDKPFLCLHDGCRMAFTNEDHLAVHQKKHGMILNFELFSKNNTYADQTPTPTRFIRNCEEVGLFQDLQNVNPFEETFKKALEQPTSNTKIPPVTSNDESTLHTPHILPHITKDKTKLQPEVVKPTPNLHIMEIESSSEEDVPIKQPPASTSQRKSINIYDKSLPQDVIRREMNRMAQKRLRLRKKELGQALELRMKRVMDKNERLQMENQELRAEVVQLKNFLRRHKDCIFVNDNSPVTIKSEQLIKPKPENIVYSTIEKAAGAVVILNSTMQPAMNGVNMKNSKKIQINKRKVREIIYD